MKIEALEKPVDETQKVPRLSKASNENDIDSLKNVFHLSEKWRVYIGNEMTKQSVQESSPKEKAYSWKGGLLDFSKTCCSTVTKTIRVERNI